jgi:hypothetical protein
VMEVQKLHGGSPWWGGGVERGQANGWCNCHVGQVTVPASARSLGAVAIVRFRVAGGHLPAFPLATGGGRHCPPGRGQRWQSL